MTDRKGELTRRQKLRDWPHRVAIVVPEMGFGARLNEMTEFVRGLNHETLSIAGRDRPDYAVWCFKREEDAKAFQSRFGGIRA